MDTAKSLEALAKQLGQGLGDGFSIFAIPQLDLVAILSAENGIAALSPTADVAAATAAAERLLAVARGAGIEASPIPLGITKGAGVPPVLVREHFVPIDILRNMQSVTRERGAPGEEAVRKLAAAILAIPKPAKPVGISENILLVAESVVRKVLKEERAWLYGIDIGAKDIVGTHYLLPAVLVVAAQRWTPPVVAAGKQGGFTVSLKADKDAVLGYAVAGVDISNPVLLFLPIVDVLRRSFRNGECWVDGLVEQFADYMEKQGHASDIQDLEVRVVVGGG